MAKLATFASGGALFGNRKDIQSRKKNQRLRGRKDIDKSGNMINMGRVRAGVLEPFLGARESGRKNRWKNEARTV